MKTICWSVLLIMLCLNLSSCEKEDFNLTENVENDFNVSLSRSSNDFDPLSELKDNEVVVYIKNVGDGNAYMSAGTDNRLVMMESKDDGSGRQRWLYDGRLIPIVCKEKCIGFGISSSKNLPILTSWTLVGGSYATLFNTSENQYYNIMVQAPKIPDDGIIGPPLFDIWYMQRESSGSNNLVYGKSNVADWAKWEIVPYGNYTIEDVVYTLYDGGGLDSVSVLVDTYTVDNTKSSVPIKRSKTVSTTVENTSTFSKTEGVTTISSVSSDASVGLPVIGDILDFNSSSSISSSITNTVSFSQDETTRKTKTISETYEVEVPAYTFYRLETFVKSYEINVKYIATLRNEGGTTFRVKGVWKGVQAVETYQKAYNQTTGKTEIVDSHSVE